MTIHKAKGLEFDHVIVPGLGRPPRGEEARLFLWTEREGGGGSELLVAPIAETGADGDPLYARLAQIDAEREDHEAARLLYVAATRARERLHLLGEVKRDEPSRAARAPGARTLLAKLWPAVARRFEDAAAAAAPVIAGTPAASAPLQQDVTRLAAGWRLPDAAARAGVARAGGARARARCDPVLLGRRDGAARRERRAPVAAALRRRPSRGLGRGAHGTAPRQRPQRARGARRARGRARPGGRAGAIGAARGDRRSAWPLGARAASVRGDRASLDGVVDGAVQRLVIDRLFEAAPGERWIVDYKTSAHEGADPEGFLDQERTRYAAQLERYARALGGTSRLGLYFPLLAGWREI